MRKKALGLEFVWKIRLQLRAEGDKLWAEGIIATYGNIKLEWKNWHKDKHSYECHLETGEKFIP